jgi:hypothetical protein
MPSGTRGKFADREREQTVLARADLLRDVMWTNREIMHLPTVGKDGLILRPLVAVFPRATGTGDDPLIETLCAIDNVEPD